MLYVKTITKESPIHGVGCFANQNISKGQIVWMFNDKTDKALYMHEAHGLWKECLEHYSWKEGNHHHIICFDNAMYINHSNNANLVMNVETGNMHAARDIQNGEELAENYEEVYGESV